MEKRSIILASMLALTALVATVGFAKMYQKPKTCRVDGQPMQTGDLKNEIWRVNNPEFREYLSGKGVTSKATLPNSCKRLRKYHRKSKRY